MLTCENNSNKENAIPYQNSNLMQTCEDDVHTRDSANKENKFPNRNLSQVDKSLHDPSIKLIKEQVNN